MALLWIFMRARFTPLFWVRTKPQLASCSQEPTSGSYAAFSAVGLMVLLVLVLLVLVVVVEVVVLVVLVVPNSLSWMRDILGGRA